MARQRKPAPQAAKTMQVRYPDDGAVEEMRGRWYDVPATVSDKRGWLESQYREEMARALAEQEKAERNQQVLNDRIAQQQRLGEQLPGRVDALEEENAALQKEIAQLRAQLAQLDETKLLEINQNTAELMGRSYDMGQQVMAQTEATRQLQDTNAAAIERWGDLREQTLAVESNRLEFWNLAQKSAGEQIQLRDDQIAKEQEHSRELSEQIGQNWQVVEQAKTITEDVKAAAQAIVRDAIEEMETDFVDTLNLALGALGLDQATLDMYANQIDANPRQALKLTRRQINQYAEIYRQSQKVMAQGGEA